MLPKTCPNCNVNLEGEDVYEYYVKTFPQEIALKYAESFGWTEQKPCNFNRVVGIYSLEKDRTTHWQCPDCKHEWSRQNEK